MSDKEKKEIREMAEIMKHLEKTEIAILMSNAQVLYARQQMEERKPA